MDILFGFPATTNLRRLWIEPPNPHTRHDIDMDDVTAALNNDNFTRRFSDVEHVGPEIYGAFTMLFICIFFA